MSFDELLGTENKQEQEIRIKELLKKEALPWICLNLSYDQVEDSVSVEISGGDITYDTIHHVLELASRGIRRKEIEQLLTELEKDEKE